MKKLKLNLFMVAALAIAAVTMSFKMVNDSTTYHYTSNSTAPGAFATTTNWATGAGSCVSDGNKPCDILVPDGSTLSSVLAGKTNSQVLDINPTSRRN
mgnify:FL=1